MLNTHIQMVDLQRQYHRLKDELDAAMQSVIESCAFINGPEVKEFAGHLSAYLKSPHVITCANGTDALQIALMALKLQPGDEVMVPAFTYAAAAEVVAMMGMTPVLVDVDPRTFNIDTKKIEPAISSRTKAIIAVHLFGQAANMEALMKVAGKYGLFVIEDNAQSIGAECLFSDGTTRKAGTIGHIGTTSFFPSKPLACFGDGGAICTADPLLAERAQLIANHGQDRKYHHKIIGCNSRLDTLQAAVLDVKLRHIAELNQARVRVAARYDEGLEACSNLVLPLKSPFSSHVYHQYTIQVKESERDNLQAYLKEKEIPSMVYYPLPLQAQDAFKWLARTPGVMEEAAKLSRSVLSLPIHTEMRQDEQDYIIETLLDYDWK